MSHRVSIVVKTRQRLKVGSDRPKFARKPAAAASQNQSFQKNVCIALFFTVEPCAQFTCYSLLVLCHSFSFSGQRSTVVQGRARIKHSSPWIGSFLLPLFFFLSLFLPTDHSQSSITVVCVLRAPSACSKKEQGEQLLFPRHHWMPLSGLAKTRQRGKPRPLGSRCLCLSFSGLSLSLSVSLFRFLPPREHIQQNNSLELNTAISSSQQKFANPLSKCSQLKKAICLHTLWTSVFSWQACGGCTPTTCFLLICHGTLLRLMGKVYSSRGTTV